jgi:hypothetical protein
VSRLVQGLIIALAQHRDIRVLLRGIETPPSHGLDYSDAFHLVCLQPFSRAVTLHQK